MNTLANGLEWIARLGLAATILAAPWFFGGYRLTDQFWIFGIVILCFALWCIAQIFRGGNARLLIPWTLIVAALFVGLGVVQLLPVSWGRPTFQHAFFHKWMAILQSGPVSIEPAATRLAIAKYGVALLAALLATQVFPTLIHRRWLWMALAANGACLTMFGVAQRLSWNGELYWSIPMRYGGQAFASYANRNNAAGYLCLCLAASLGALATLGAREESLAALRARFRKAHLVRPLRSWDGIEIVTLVLAACTFVGVFASLSRGGMIAGVLTFALGALMLWVMLGNRVIVYGIVFLLVPIAGALWLNLDQSIQQRLGTLTTASAVRGDARWQHWTDTLKALPDAPVGSGLGTYRYLNRPYQQHAARGWYYNADNQYVETLVEMGVAGLVVVLACIGCVVRTAYTAWSSTLEVDLRDVAIVLATLVVAQADLAITDFGVSMPANLLTLGLIVGTCLGAFPNRPGSKTPEVAGWSALVLGISMLALPSTGLAEVRSAAAQSAFLDRIPSLEQPNVPYEPDAISNMITEGESLIERRPDNAALHLALAELWFYQLRAEASVQLQNLYPELHPTHAWGYTSPLSLFRQTLLLKRTGNEAALDSLRGSPALVKSLIPAWTHLQKSHAACPYVPQTHFLIGCLCPLMGAEESQALAHFRHEMALSPFDAARLLSVGLAVQQLNDTQTAMSLWKRALTLDPETVHHVFQVALRVLTPKSLLDQVIPESPPVLLHFVEQTPDQSLRDAAIERLLRLLPEEAIATSYENWMRGRAALIQSRWDDAASALQKASYGSPYQINYLADFVQALERLERWDDAYREALRLQLLDPENSKFAEKASQLLRQREEHRRQDLLEPERERQTPATPQELPPPNGVLESTRGRIPSVPPCVLTSLAQLCSIREPGVTLAC